MNDLIDRATLRATVLELKAEWAEQEGGLAGRLALADALQAINEQSAAPSPALTRKHKPGDFHEYEAKCRICGQPGQVYIELRPTQVGDKAEAPE